MGVVIENTLDQKLTHYLNIKLLQQMVAEKDVLKQVDNKNIGTEKFSYFFACNSRDLTRFEKLYKDHGCLNNSKQLDSVFILKSIKPRFESSPEYIIPCGLEGATIKSCFL